MSPEVPGPAAGREHADDLVSAHLDGELDAETDAWVAEHLTGCAECRGAADAAAAARAIVLASPTVDATPFVEQVIARRRRVVGTGLAFVGIVAFGLGVLGLTASVIHPKVAPDVDELAGIHAGTAHDVIDDMESVDDGGRHYATPVRLRTSLDGTAYGRAAVFDGIDLTSVVYEGNGTRVTVFQQPGRLDWDELPDGDVEELAGRRAWIRRESPVVIVTEIGHLVVTGVADDEPSLRAVVASLPGPERDSTLDRIHDSCQRLTEIFGLGR